MCRTYHISRVHPVCSSTFRANGTHYFDEHFMRKHEKDAAKFKAGAPKSWHDSLRDKVTAAMLDISLPVYKVWRNQWKDPEAILYLAPR